MTGRRPLPGAAALDWARALLLDAAERDRSGSLAAGLSQFDSWESLAGLAETPWLEPARRPSALAQRRARHRLRLLGSAPASFTAAAGQGSVEPVHLRGVCARLPGTHPIGDGDLWRREIIDNDSGRWLVEEGHDFTLTESAGEVVLVLAAGGRLVNTARLRPGDQVSVFGFADQVPDTTGHRSPHGRGGLTLALRSGSELPLLVCLIRRYDRVDDAPRR